MATAVQTTVVSDPQVGFSGGIYDSGEKDVISCIAQGPIAFGQFVKISASNCIVPALTGDVTGYDGGIALADPVKASSGSSSAPVGAYAAGDIVQVMRRGRVWVSTEGALAAQARPFVRFTVNGGLVPGGIRVDADAGKAVQPTGVRVYRGVAAAGLAVLQLDYPNMHAVGG